MRARTQLIVIGIAVVATLLLGPRLGFCASCGELASISFDPGFTITSATIVAATPTVPEYCKVQGILWPEGIVVLQLPTSWNNRVVTLGNGGAAGSVPRGDTYLPEGFATGATDTGHQGISTDWSFAYGPPNNPANINAEQKRVDHAYRALHETVVLLKKISKAYYGSDPVYSYYVGGSTGGRQGTLEANRFPQDFDGLLIGYPSLNYTAIMTWCVWNAVALSGEGAIPVEKLPILADAVYANCDSVDGLVDGLIDDPRKCTFNPAVDLPKCAGMDGPNCFTPKQIEALQKVYGGPKNSSGQQLFPGVPVGAEALRPIAPGSSTIASGWTTWLIGSPSRLQQYGSGFMQYFAFTPVPGPTYDWTKFNYDTDYPRMASLSLMFDGYSPLSGDINLWPLKNRGGKILMYNGWADTAALAPGAIEYYERVLKQMGEKETRDFFKLYLVPGMEHASPGFGAAVATMDYFHAVIQWVEKGIAPDVFVGQRAANTTMGWPVRTRPVCPYPEVARYMGEGSIEDAANFSCVSIIPTAITVTPSPLSLSSRTFEVTMDLPKESQKNWGDDYGRKNGRHGKILSVVCEGAPSVRTIGHIGHGNMIKATFNTKDLVNIVPSNAVTFTMTVILDEDVAFEGSGRVKVVP